MCSLLEQVVSWCSAECGGAACSSGYGGTRESRGMYRSTMVGVQHLWVWVWVSVVWVGGSTVLISS